MANYLVCLRDQERPLDNGQADTILKLWAALSDYDKRPAVFSPRFSSMSPRGGLKPLKSTVAPGVEATHW